MYISELGFFFFFGIIDCTWSRLSGRILGNSRVRWAFDWHTYHMNWKEGFPDWNKRKRHQEIFITNL